MKKTVLTLIISAIALAATAQVTLDSCRHMALRNNKEIAGAQLKIEQAGYNLSLIHI